MGQLTMLVAGHTLSSAVSGVALVVGSDWWADQLGGVTASAVAVLGTSPIGYAVGLTWLSRRRLSLRTGQTLALLDAIWVVGSAGLLAVVGTNFSDAGLAAVVGAAGVVAALGWSQWRASSRPSQLVPTPPQTSGQV